MARISERSLIIGVDSFGKTFPVLLDEKGRVIVDTKSKSINKVWTPIVSTSPAYTAADAFGAKFELTNVFSAIGHGSYLKNLIVTDKGKQNAALDVVFFNASPTNTTVTDNGALTIHDTDLLTIVGRATVAVTDYTSFADNSEATIEKTLGVLSDLSTSLWVIGVIRGTPTYVSTSDLQLRFVFLQD